MIYEAGRYYPPEVSMERSRDLRDYALIHGFAYARDFLASLQSELYPGSTFLDLGCGNGRAISQAARQLAPSGVSCIAVDTRLPSKQFPFIQYLENSFDDLALPDASVDLALSVCGLFMYAEDPAELRVQTREVARVLKPGGKLSVVVDPVVSTPRYDAQMAAFRKTLEHNRTPGGFVPLTPEQLDRLRHISADRRIEIALHQTIAQEIRVQSPTRKLTYFKTNIGRIVEQAGLEITQRIRPRGGKMIDDDITLIMHKKKK